jgi:hypothetical protein
LEAVHFVCIFFVLGGVAFGQSNIPPSPSQSVVPRNSQRMPAFVATREQKTPQSVFGFANAVTYDTGGFQAEAVVSADLNGDGKPDLVLVNACGGDSSCPGGTVGVLLNNDDGTFGTAVTYGTNGWLAQAVAVGDLNGDGKVDIVVANNCASDPGTGSCTTDGNVAVLLGNGDGTFQAALVYDSGGSLASSVVIADVNGDGKPDLLVVNRCGSSTTCAGNGTVAVLLGNGDGTFQTAVNYDTGALQSNAVAVADVNGDGKLDLVVSNTCQVGTCDNVGDQSGSVSVLLGNGDGTFKETANYTSGSYGTDAVAVADLNGDGKVDIAVSSSCAGPRSSDCGAGNVSVFLGNGDGTFQSGTSLSTVGIGTGGVRVADVDGDGKPDLLVSGVCATNPVCDPSTSAPSSAGVLLGNGDGTFQTAQYFGSIGYSYGITSGLAAGDLTGDGKLDLIVTSWCADASCSTGAAEHSLVGVLIAVTGTGQDFSLTSSSPTASVMQGKTANYVVTVSPLAGFSQTVTLSCSGAPAQSMCSVSPSSVTLNGSTSTSVNVTVTTGGSSASAARPAFSPPSGSTVAFWLPLLGLPSLALVGIFGGRSRKRPSRKFCTFALLCLLSAGVSMSACGGRSGSSNSGGTPAGTYNLTVTGSFISGSTSLTHTAKLTLVVVQ